MFYIYFIKFGLIRFSNTKELKDNQGLLLFQTKQVLYAIVFIEYPITCLIDQIIPQQQQQQQQSFINQNLSPRSRTKAQAIQTQALQNQVLQNQALQQLKANPQLIQSHAGQIGLTPGQAHIVKAAQAAQAAQAVQVAQAAQAAHAAQVIQGQTQPPTSHIALSATPSALGMVHPFQVATTEVPVANLQNQRIQFPLALQQLQIHQNPMILQQQLTYQSNYIYIYIYILYFILLIINH